MTDKSMSQEEIDALLAGMSGNGGEAAPAPTAPAQPPPAGGMVVDQGELDALLASLTGESEEVPAPNGPVDQNELDALLAQLDTGSSSEPLPAQKVAVPETPGAPLGQNDIDAILANLDAAPSVAPPAPPAAAAPAAPPDGPLGQDDIDAMLASMNDAPPPAPAAPAPAPSGPLGQDDIDAMLASMNDAPPAPAAAPPAAEGPLGQDGIDALLASMDNAPPAAPAAPPANTSKANSPAVASAAAALPAGKLGQDDIDSLLNNLGAEQITVGADKAGLSKTLPAAGSLSRSNLALTTEDLTALVTKHGAPTTGEPADGMIDQGDIDALVKQLGAATGTIEAPADKPSMTEELARHDAAIDQILAGGKPTSANAVTMDAIDFKGLGDKSPATSGVQRGLGPAYTVNVPVLTPPELRGARYLLAAAVLLLAICAGTLIVVAGAVGTLGTELARERAANLEPGDDYGTDFAAAISRLASPDEDQVATGVLFLQRLRKRSPSHDSEIGLALARHFRSHGAWKEAGREYAAVIDDPRAVSDDPRVFVEYADTLRELDDRDGSRRQLYALLADEARWIGPALSSQSIERNRHTLVEAHLLLARLLDGAPAPTLAAADTEHASDHATGHGAASEHHSSAKPEAAAHGASEGHH